MCQNMPLISPEYLIMRPQIPLPVMEKIWRDAGLSFPAEPLINLPLKTGQLKDSKTIQAGFKPTIGDIFRIYGKEFRQNNKLTLHHLDVMYAIENCRTGTYGFHIDVCDSCGHSVTLPNSCRDRHCPNCQGNKRFDWVDKRIDELLPVPYYHNIFTLPEQFYPMCLYNQKVIYDLLFRCSAETLKEFGLDPKWLGGKTGFFGILHTWGQLMGVHLHIHYVMPAVGIDENGNWIFPKDKDKFLFPVQAMSKVFRGKFIDGLKAAKKEGKLEFPGEIKELGTDKGFNRWINSLFANQWVVFTKAPFASPEEVVKYIGRYTHQVAISNTRIISIDNGIIRFTYKNYKKQNEVQDYKDLWEETELTAEEFIRRFMFHVVPSGYHRIRHFGFLANGQKSKRPELWENPAVEKPAVEEPKKEEKGDCPQCGKGRMIPVIVIDRYDRIIKGSFSELIWRKNLFKQPVTAAVDL